MVFPPNFDDLPKPQGEEEIDRIEDKDIDFSSILKTSNNEKKITKKNNTLERSISDILSGN